VARLSAAIDRDALRPLINVPFDNDLEFKRALREATGEQTMREHSAELIQAAIDVDAVIVLLGILGFVASFAVSLGPVMWCLLAEIFPNRARGPAMAFVGFFNSMASFAVQLVFPWELSHLGNASIFFIYACFGVVAFLLVGWLLPETKGKSLEELETILVRRA
jgi:SP family arabinose:H+ symporter-like MFS transporter